MRISARFELISSCLLIISFVVAWTGADAAAEQTVRINGSGTGLEMMKPLIKEYLKSHPGVRFEMEKPLGSSGAIKAILAGALDIVVTSKPLKQEEITQGASLKIFGKTPLAIVAGRNVPVNDISTAELENIYSGVTKQWKNNKNIRVVLRPHDDIDTKILRGLSSGMDKAITKAQNQPGMLVAVTDPESNEAVLRSDSSIGASGLSGIIAGNIPLKILSLNGVMPGTKTLADGRYPLSKDLNFVTKGNLPDAAAKFLDFIYSPKGRMIASKTGVLVTAGSQSGNK